MISEYLPNSKHELMDCSPTENRGNHNVYKYNNN